MVVDDVCGVPLNMLPSKGMVQWLPSLCSGLKSEKRWGECAILGLPSCV